MTRLLVYDTEMRSANGYLPKAIEKAACRVLGQQNAKLVDHIDVVHQARSGGWDILLALGGAGADRNILQSLMELPICRVLWTTEDPYERRLITLVEKAFHHIYTNERICDQITPKTTHLPLAAEEEFHYRRILENEGDFLYDLSFVGTAWPNRVASLKKILPKLPSGLRVQLCLPWNRHLPEPNIKGIDAIPSLRMGIHDLCNLWNRSRIVLTLGREFAINPTNDPTARGISPPPRLYETAMAGGFQIAIGLDKDEISSAYYESIPVAENEQRAAELIMYFLSNHEERIKLARQSQEVTLSEHTYDQRIRQIIREVEGLSSAQRQSSLHVDSSETNILHLSHNLNGIKRGGGTESYIHNLALAQKELAPSRRIVAVAPIDNSHLGIFEYSFSNATLVNKIDVGHLSAYAASNKSYERAFCDIICNYGIGIVHIHQLIGLPLGLPLFAKALGCKLVATIHDFYLACHRYTLLKPDGLFCNVHERHEYLNECGSCLREAGFDGTERTHRLDLTRRIVGAVDKFIISSTSSAEIISGVYPELKSKIEVIEMLTPDIDQFQVADIPSDSNGRNSLEVGIIGNVVPHKGLKDLVLVIGQCKDASIRFHILGATRELDTSLREAGIGLGDDSQITTYQGAYQRPELLELLSRVDAALFLSTWPETYHISLGEAMIMGVVPIATEIGAHTDRIKHGVNGLLVPPNDPDAVLEAIQTLQTSPQLLKRLQQGAKETPLMNTREHALRVDTIYKKLDPWSARIAWINEDRLEVDHQVDLLALGIRVFKKSWNKSGIDWDPPQ